MPKLPLEVWHSPCGRGFTQINQQPKPIRFAGFYSVVADTACIIKIPPCKPNRFFLWEKFMSGWIKLHRNLQGSAIASHPEYLAVWVHLMLRAQYSESECVVGRQIVKLSIGQLIFGRIKFSSDTGVSEGKVRAALEVMKNLNMITIKSMAKFSIISITNWKSYQDDNHQITTKQPSVNQQMTSNQPADDHIQEGKELKESKEGKELKDYVPKNKFSDEDKKCAEWLIGKLHEYIPDCKKPNLYGWSEHVRKMRELDNRDHKDICQIWLWCRKDSFEAANVQSPEKLRKRYDQLKTKMKSPGAGANNANQPKSPIERFMRKHYPNGTAKPEDDRGSMGGDDGIIRGVMDEELRGDSGRIRPMDENLIGSFSRSDS